MMLACAAAVAVAAGFERRIFYDGSPRSRGRWALAGDAYVARELRRYVYHATGALPSLADTRSNASGAVAEWLGQGGAREAVVLTSPGGGLASAGCPALRTALAVSAEDGAHAVVVCPMGASRVTALVGAGDTGRLYAVATAAEQLGIRFEVHGDVLPDPTQSGGLPLRAHASAHLPLQHAVLDSPLFTTRGLQPFHDFPEGPDWWDGDMYKLVITQISKMKMNFVGLHTYPYADGIPTTGKDEPTVWVGTVDGLYANGSVKPEAAYLTSYANTGRSEWGMQAKPTSEYNWGTGEIFESDCWAPPPMSADSCPYPSSPQSAAALFDRTSAMLNDAFTYGKAVGVQSCVGTETPLSAPTPPPPKCWATGAPVCYRDTTARVLPHTVTLRSERNTLEWCAGECALAGYRYAGVEYAVACFCSNKLPNATVLDPKECAAMKCAGNRSENCGGSYVVSVYPFECENTTAAAPTTQEYYEGIFTRLNKTVPALDWYWVWTPEAWEWGKMKSTDPVFTKAIDDLTAAMAAHDRVIPDVKMATNGWVVGPLPDRSIFDKTLPETWDAITSIDLNTGHDPVDPAYVNVTRHPKWAIPWMEDDPDMTAPQLWVNRTLKHMEDAKRYGCSGLLGIHWRTRQTSPQISAMAQKSWQPSLTSADFWRAWAEAQFGAAVADSAAAVFESVDSELMPLVVQWSGGPGKMHPTCLPAGTFAFVDLLSGIRASVSGAQNGARFDYWLNQFEFMRSLAAAECAWDGVNKAVKAGDKAAAVAGEVMLVQNVTAMMRSLQRSFSTMGDLGNYVDLESHSMADVLGATSEAVRKLAGSLPPAAQAPKTFVGKPILTVPVARSTADEGAPFSIRALVLAEQRCAVTLFHRELGAGPFTSTAFANANRSVFTASLPAPRSDFEWYASAACGGDGAVFPAGAPDVTHSVVLL
eukprot:TRINITY_DN28586_c0_g1_i1.p1 TRINITY_DN28586_c0_g1~~TRINITY_DN28586_c0_g1_i1.p1  ORF type:complete len:929 (+),score=311.43 TRINITY_DN28586_c0_g1_i1:88-2874(+)